MTPLFVFDFDGTLCDSIEDFITVMNLLAESYRFRPVLEADRIILRDLPSNEIARYLNIKAWKIPLIVREARLEMQKRIDDMKLFDGLTETFEELERLQIPVWVLTSNSRVNVDAFLNQRKLRVQRVFAESSLFGKGNMLRGMLKREKISADTPVVYIGDETRDVEAARKAGVFSAAVTWGYSSEKALHDAKPDFILREARDILSLLQLKVENLRAQKGFDL